MGENFNDDINLTDANVRRLKIGTVYRHYKGKEYLVLHIAKRSETLDDMVVYQALYSEMEIGGRPLMMS